MGDSQGLARFYAVRMRWAPGALIAAALLLWVDGLAGGGLVGGVPALIVVAALSVLTGLRCALWQVLVIGLAAAMLLAVADQVQAADQFSIASDGVFYGVMVLAPALVGWLVGARNRQVAELTARRRQLERRRDVSVRAALAREREQVTRRVDLVLSGRLRAIVADATALNDAHGPAAAAGLAAVESTARAALAELREILGVLREVAPVTEQHSEPGGTARDRPRLGVVDALLVLAVVPLAIETAAPGHRGWWWLNVLAALVQGTALVAIRRRPIPGVLALIAAAAAQTAFLAPLPPTIGWLLPGLLAVFLVGFCSDREAAVCGLAAMIAGVCVVTVVTPAGSRAMGGFVASLIIGVLAWCAGRFAEARDRQARELRAITEELDRTVDQEGELAAVEQRAQLARELHDVGAHALTVVCLQAGAAQAWWDRDRDHAQPALDSVMAIARGPIAQLSSSLDGLMRDELLAPLDADALEALAGLSRALGLRVEISVTGMPSQVRADIARTAYRIVQEALTNAARYAGRTQVRVQLDAADDLVEVRVIDSGPDATLDDLVVPVGGAGLGLRGMRERVDALNGELEAGSCGAGFQVLARIPT